MNNARPPRPRSAIADDSGTGVSAAPVITGKGEIPSRLNAPEPVPKFIGTYLPALSVAHVKKKDEPLDKSMSIPSDNGVLFAVDIIRINLLSEVLLSVNVTPPALIENACMAKAAPTEL